LFDTLSSILQILLNILEKALVISNWPKKGKKRKAFGYNYRNRSEWVTHIQVNTEDIDSKVFFSEEEDHPFPYT
jgi:hypothetical protein